MSIKKYRVLGLMFLALTLVLVPGPTNSAMWVGGEIGGNFIQSTTLHAGDSIVSNMKFDPSVIGGITIGYDFVNTGFLGYNYPDWMKYFSFAVDFTYNRMQMRGGEHTVQTGAVTNNAFFGKPAFDGYMAALTFLFMAHYGFMPDSEAPGGRINPYVGVGPAILFSGGHLNDVGNLSNGSSSSTDIALVAEAGIRWVCLKNVSIDTSYRFRYARPSYDFSRATFLNPAHVAADIYSHSFLVRANYHF